MPVSFSLCREELAYGAQEVVNDCVKAKAEVHSSYQALVEYLQTEYDLMVKDHSDSEPNKFNDDVEYKRITAEAIELKSLALKKMRLYVQLKNDTNEGQLQEILKRPIIDFAIENFVMELETGIRGFPWVEVAGKSATVDFGDWTPKGLDSPKMEKLVLVLSSNEELRTVTVGAKKERLMLNEGWATAGLLWDGSAAVQASVDVIALLLPCFSRLSSLSLR
jgi:hypothetical protein